MSVELIAIGASLGGVRALTELFSRLPDDFDVPIAVVLHRGSMENDYLIDVLQKGTTIEIQEASDRLTIVNHKITIAPADYHLLVDSGRFALSVDAPVNHARPSIDVLFDSVAMQYGSTVLGILLTGGGEDGVRGLKNIKDRNGSVMVQCPETAQDATLPQAAIDAAIATIGYPIDQLSSHIATLCDPTGKHQLTGLR